MDIKKNWEEIITFGTENDKNRATVIKQASYLILMLNQTSGKRLSSEELKKFSGGLSGPGCGISHGLF